MLYKNNKLKEISFPLGGIGTGSIGLAGNGSLIDWEIFNRPNKGSINPYSFFAVKAEFPDGKSTTKVLHGDWTKDLTGQHGRTSLTGFGLGPTDSSMCGFPHFKKVRFDGKFPFATLTFEDEDFPAKVVMKAFNPFIPLDQDNSSIPAAFFEIKIISNLDNVKYKVVLSVRNPFKSSVNQIIENDKYTAVKLSYAEKDFNDKEYGDLTVAVDSKNGICQEYWYRGISKDNISTFWHELTKENLKSRHYDQPRNNDVCSVGAEEVINKNSSGNFRFVLSWNIPNNYNYWSPYKDKKGNDITWKNYYATIFKDSVDSCFYSLDNWNMLYKKTARFVKSLHSCTLDKSIIDAVSSTISVLKSPTVLRLEDGTFYGWEGVFATEGSCEGTCTHVWSYAYALCFLFPDLERSLRDTELKYDINEHGEMQFRTQLPIGRKHTISLPCLDGQMATIIKIYRDWKITGNTKWLKNNWKDIKKILEFAWNENNAFEWDKDKDGVLEGRQHHTLDVEIFGPSSWLQGMYLCALKAAAKMAEFLGDTEKAKEYTEIFEKGYAWTKENLFNGNYFYHKVDLNNKNYIEHFNCPKYWNEEQNELKYQIGEGSGIDQMLGQWHSNICGLGDIFDKEQRKIALQSMMKNNFKENFRNYANIWRVFAINDEGGTIMFEYPENSKMPIIPITYREEVMTGFEYSFAGLLISEGFIEDGLKVIRAVRNRYDGEKRNPWNEIECGSNYARPMSSFALMPIFSGFTFDVPNKHIGFAPIIPGDFKCMWNLGTGWGDFIKTKNQYKITVADGYLELNSLAIKDIKSAKKVFVDKKELTFSLKDKVLFFDTLKAKKEIVVVL